MRPNEMWGGEMGSQREIDVKAEMDKAFSEASKINTEEAVKSPEKTGEIVKGDTISVDGDSGWEVKNIDEETGNFVVHKGNRFDILDRYDVAAWNRGRTLPPFTKPAVKNNFEDKKLDINSEAVLSAGSIEELKKIIMDFGGVEGSKDYFTAKQVVDSINKMEEEDGSILDITRSASIRGKVFELIIEKGIDDAQDMEDLISVVKKTGGIIGSSEFFSAEEVTRALQSVKAGGRLSDVTKSLGLREKAWKIMTASGATYDDTEFGNRTN